MSLRPDGPKDFTCPFHRKSMAKVCRTCPMWQQVRGYNPNTGEPVDRWDCALALMPLLAIENTQMQRQTGAAVESFRNEMVRLNHSRLEGPPLTTNIAPFQHNQRLVGAEANGLGIYGHAPDNHTK